jgi:hypothetical protein
VRSRCGVREQQSLWENNIGDADGNTVYALFSV